MIDTIGVKYWHEIPQAELDSDWKFTRKQSGRGYRLTYHRIGDLENGTCVHATYIPHSYKKGEPLLIIELSLPRAAYGSNVHPVSDIPEAVALVNPMLWGLGWLPKIDLMEGILLRLDVCWNHDVGDLVWDYIRAMQNLAYPHRHTEPYSGEGVQFRSKSVTTSFYNKHLEYGEPSAYGILRHETTYRKRSIQRVTKLKNALLKDVTPDQVRTALIHDLIILKLNDRVIGTYDLSLQVLCDRYGGKNGVCLFGLLQRLAINPSLNALQEVTGLSDRTIRRYIRQIYDAGLAPSISLSQPLPPLTIAYDADESRKNVRKYQVILPYPHPTDQNLDVDTLAPVSMP